MNNKILKEKLRDDAGFGSKTTNSNIRLVLPNGNFNVKKLNQSWISKLNIYHRLVTVRLWVLMIIILIYYFSANLFFGTIYFYLDKPALTGIVYGDDIEKFWECFFFSAQTITTLGYGKIAPEGTPANIISAIESLLGLLTFSIVTGVLYGRFSNPSPKLRFSKNGVIAPYLDGKGLMFRIANEKDNQLINVEVKIIFSRNEEKNGQLTRAYYILDLERSKVTYFALSWTLVHPITEESPLWGENEKSLTDSTGEFLISFQGINDTNGEMVYLRKSFLYSEILWNKKFVNVINSDNNTYVIDLDRLDEIEHS